MTWLALLLNLVKLLSILVQRYERQNLVTEIEQVERARIILEINRRLAEVSQVPKELQAMNETELNRYVEKKKWFRD